MVFSESFRFQNPHLTSLCLIVFLISALALSAETKTEHVEGLRQHHPRLHAITDVRIVHSSGTETETGTVLVRDNKIVEAGVDVEIPKDAEVIKLTGKTIYPGLIDSFGEVSFDAASKRPPTAYWNSQIRADFQVSSSLKKGNLSASEHRKQGFVARMIAPETGILRGQCAVYSLGDESVHSLLLRDNIALSGELTIPRGGDRKNYPNSPMGAVALARQAFYDATWYRDAHRAAKVDPSLPLPEQNVTLETLQSFLDGAQPVLLETSNELFALRADDFASEFNLDLIIVGSGNEYRRLAEITATKRPIIVPVAFPKAPNVATPEAAAGVTLESLMHWDHAPENLARLEAQGVEILLTTHRLNSKADFLKNLRLAVKRGFSQDAALDALTVVPAKRFGIDEQLGTIENGKLASFVVTDGNLFDKETKIIETWVNGERYEHEKDPEVELTGDWKLTLSNVPENADSVLLLNITGDEKLKGKVRKENTLPDFEEKVEVKKFARDDGRLIGQFIGDQFGPKGVATFSIPLTNNDEKRRGTLSWPDGAQSTLLMTKNELAEANDSESVEAEESNEDDDDDDEKEDEDAIDRSLPASFPVNFPLGAYGRVVDPTTSSVIAFTAATVWTSGPEGIIKNGTVIIEDGKILAVGKNILMPENAKVINLKGKHLTPGLIDCHSHIASDGGINESAQAVTAEVRIGDFVDCDDIDIYWQLAGGLTTSNILHGSANPIGGQNQVIKMRWGANYEELRFKSAPGGVKFALGENVKQSNWGDDYTTRYPQTRMGVEQIMRDEFLEAREYASLHQAYAKNRRGIPPRVNLELQAIAEVLAGERWIHCHSYRQDEILALIRTLDDFDVTIGSFQHILEGYKVADAMAKHGATGSSFSDWWAYKVEVQDAIPFNGAIMHKQGIVVSFNSDDGELGRRMNQEAAKALKYGRVPPAEALKFVTLNPAIQLRIDKQVGSLEIGKDADLAIWSGSPLSNLSRCEQTWIDGRKYFDRDEVPKQRAEVASMRNKLIQKILDTRAPMMGEGEESHDPSSEWPRHDEFCHAHGDHHHEHGGHHE